MDKIRELLEQLGASEELVAQFCEELEAWKASEHTKLQEDLKTRLQRAKGVCLEEVGEYKQALARKVEVFLESQVTNIERSAKERTAIEESKAANQLKQLKSLLEGVNIGGENGDLQATVEENKKLRDSLVTVAEQRDAFEKKASHATDIANKVIHRNRILESKITSEAEPKKKPVTEGKDKKGTKLGKQEKGVRKSTQRTLQESQERKTKETKVPQGDAEIMSIAGVLDEAI